MRVWLGNSPECCSLSYIYPGQITRSRLRGLSDLSHEETFTVVDIPQRFQNQTDEEEQGQEVIDTLQKVVRKLNKSAFLHNSYNASRWPLCKVVSKNIPFSDANILSLPNAGIKVHFLKLTNAKERELGDKLRAPDAFVPEGNRCIDSKCVSFKVSLLKTEAGSRVLINAIFIPAVSNLSTFALHAAIAPEFRIPETSLESGASAYDRPIDYLIALEGPWAIDLCLS